MNKLPHQPYLFKFRTENSKNSLESLTSLHSTYNTEKQSFTLHRVIG